MADLILYLHFAYVLAVLVPIPLIVIGNQLGWSWVRKPGWRRIHLAMIFIVVLEAVVGIVCPLTELESYLRRHETAETYPRGFISEMVSRWLFYDAEPWVFTSLYIAVATIIVALYWKIPPTRNSHPR